jgi:hypothetical protein
VQTNCQGPSEYDGHSKLRAAYNGVSVPALPAERSITATGAATGSTSALGVIDWRSEVYFQARFCNLAQFFARSLCLSSCRLASWP